MGKSIIWRVIIIFAAITGLTVSGLLAATNVYVVNEKDNGQTITLKKDQQLELSLVTNPSTGYGWQYVQYPDSNVLKETKHYLVSASKLIGSPSVEYWWYNPVNFGFASFSLQYSRSWSNDPPLKTFNINIIIK